VIPIGFKTVPPGGGELPEHYGRWMDPFVSLAVASAVTKKIKLGTGICLLPEREPLVTAKAIATLDVVSGGRVILGVGAGWLKEETEATGAAFGTRWKRLRETVEALRILWTRPEASYEGELVRFAPLRCEPKPIQKNGPPILLGAHGPKGRERVIRSYDGWCPVAGKPADFKRESAELRALAKERGRNPETLQIMAFVPPREDGLSLDDLKAYQESGAERLVLFSQRDAIKMANGQALEVIRRIAPTVERATHL
jgi:probable F420-dependent oxidoreductase